MAGGIRQVKLDCVDDFLQLRKKVFGFELAPLPEVLALPEADLALDRLANVTLQGSFAASHIARETQEAMPQGVDFR